MGSFAVGDYLAVLLEQVWNRHFFVLTATKLHYTEETNQTSTNDDDDDESEVDAPAQVWHLSL